MAYLPYRPDTSSRCHAKWYDEQFYRQDIVLNSASFLLWASFTQVATNSIYLKPRHIFKGFLAIKKSPTFVHVARCDKESRNSQK